MQQEMPSPSQINALGKLFWEALLVLRQLDQVYKEAGPQRSAELVRCCLLQSLEVVNHSVRIGLHIMNVHDRRSSGDDSMLDINQPLYASALRLAYHELLEVHAGRVAPLFRHDAQTQKRGENSFNCLRRYIQAGAAAAIQALRETNLREPEAAELVTDCLNKRGFVNPKASTYARGGVRDWRKRRRDKKAGFEDQYNEWLLYFRGTAGRVELCRQRGQSITDEEARSTILSQLVNLLEFYAYRV